MTISTDNSRMDYVGNDITEDFPIDFQFASQEEIGVHVLDANGVNQEWTLHVDYAISHNTGIGGDRKGTLHTVAGPLPALWTMAILRATDLTQLLSYIEHDTFPAKSHEWGLDKITMIIQQQQEEIARCWKNDPALPDPPDVELPPPVSRRALLWAPDETGRIINSTLDPDEAQEDARVQAVRSEVAADRSEAARDRSETAAGIAEDLVQHIIGEIRMWPTETIPTGFALCDGRVLSAAANPLLFATIGYRYGGVGDDFNIPDYRGVFMRGTDSGIGRDPDRATRTDRGDGTVGDAVGTRQGFATVLTPHTHTFYNGSLVQVEGAADQQAQHTSASIAQATSDASVTGDAETRPLNVGINFIIAIG